jgi:hypothetical protein
MPTISLLNGDRALDPEVVQHGAPRRRRAASERIRCIALVSWLE